MAGEYKREDLCMEHLIREFGAWLKQGFGWLVDVIVFGCLWGISQVSRLLGTHFGGRSLIPKLTFVKQHTLFTIGHTSSLVRFSATLGGCRIRDRRSTSAPVIIRAASTLRTD